MPLGLKHTEETKEKIGAAARGKGKGGFNVIVNCPDCGRPMSPANLGKHAPACEKTKRLTTIFGFRPSTAKMKVFERILRVYKLSTDDFLVQWELQQGKCSICQKSLVGLEKGRRIVNIDHAHGTGIFRGLLCLNCNTLIGHAREDISILNAAVNYLKKYVKKEET